MDNQIIFSVALAKILIKEGFRVVDICKNKSNSDRSIYYFENKDGLTDLIADYTISQRQKKLKQNSLITI